MHPEVYVFTMLKVIQTFRNTEIVFVELEGFQLNSELQKAFVIP